MVKWINTIGLLGLVFGALGPLLIVLANTTEIWRWQTNTDQLDQLEDARNQVLSSSLPSDDPAFKTLYQRISEEISPNQLITDLPPIDEINRMFTGVGYGGSRECVFYEKDDNSEEPLVTVNEFERLLNTQIQDLRYKGRQYFFIAGMISLVLGFIFQFIAYYMNNPPI